MLFFLFILLHLLMQFNILKIKIFLTQLFGYENVFMKHMFYIVVYFVAEIKQQKY